MNAPSTILADPIGTFMPECGGEERQLRARLYRARDIATSRVIIAKSSDARELYWMVVRTVTAWLYRSAKLEELQGALNHCVRLFLCADFAEREGPE